MDDDGPRRLSPTYVLVLLNNPPVISLDTFPPITARNRQGSVQFGLPFPAAVICISKGVQPYLHFIAQKFLRF